MIYVYFKLYMIKIKFENVGIHLIQSEFATMNMKI
jgi:hypothetical protein